MWDPYVGRKVVCISDNWELAVSNTVAPKRDEIYTIREVQRGLPPFQRHMIGLRFYEIVNPIVNFSLDGSVEPAFDIVAFRPLEERETDISVFEQLLAPSGTKVPDGCEELV